VNDLPGSGRIARADAFFAVVNIPIITCGDQACYRPDIDTGFIPPFERFNDAASYHGCLGHETGDATGAAHRLGRDLSGRFGSAKYAMDEIIVELTSSFIKADPGIAHTPAPSMLGTLHWVQVLKTDREVRPVGIDRLASRG